MTSNPASSSLEVKPEMTSWPGSVASEVCGGERSGFRRIRLGPAAKYLLSRERGMEKKGQKRKVSK